MANPPRGIRRELVAAAVLKFLNRLHQAHVALLNKIQKRQAAVGVLFGDGDHEAQVGLHHLGLGFVRLAAKVMELAKFLQVILGGHAHKKLQRMQLFPLSINDGFASRGLAPLARVFNGPGAGLNSILNVLRHGGHFLDDLLLVEEFRE